MEALISWNVAGIKARQGDVAELMAVYRPDIVCLQKTRTADAPNQDGYMVYSCCADRWSGVVTYCREDRQIHLLEEDTHHQIFDCGEFVLINAYVPFSNGKLPDTIQRRKEWNRWVREYVMAQTKPVIMCGDLNIVHTALDTCFSKWSRQEGCYYPWERDDFDALLRDGALVDTYRHVHPDERGYTYFDTMHGVDYQALNQGSRLDYFLMSESMLEKLERSDILPGMSAPSLPLLMTLR